MRRECVLHSASYCYAWLIPSDLQAQDLFPLRDSLFEGQMAKIPYNYGRLLTEEYGKASLTKTKYSGYDYYS